MTLTTQDMKPEHPDEDAPVNEPVLTADELLEVSETLTCTGAIYRYRMRLDGQCKNLLDLLAPVEDLGAVAKTISGCIDSRSQASYRCSSTSSPCSPETTIG